MTGLIRESAAEFKSWFTVIAREVVLL